MTERDASMRSDGLSQELASQNRKRSYRKRAHPFHFHRHGEELESVHRQPANKSKRTSAPEQYGSFAANSSGATGVD